MTVLTVIGVWFLLSIVVGLLLGRGIAVLREDDVASCAEQPVRPATTQRPTMAAASAGDGGLPFGLWPIDSAPVGSHALQTIPLRCAYHLQSQACNAYYDREAGDVSGLIKTEPRLSPALTLQPR